MGVAPSTPPAEGASASGGAMPSSDARRDSPASLVPDWATDTLLLAWPRPVKKRKRLVPLYEALVAALPPKLPLVIVANAASSELDALAAARRATRVVAAETLTDIWIRDWGPMPVVGPSGDVATVRTTYSPRYLSGFEARADDKAGEGAAAALQTPLASPAAAGLEASRVSLKCDGGALVWNGAGVAITTERVLADNARGGRGRGRTPMPVADLRALLRDRLAVETLVVVPEEPGDETGHIDGIARFADATTLLLAEYPPDYGEGAAYLAQLHTLLRNALPATVSIKRVPAGMPSEDGAEGMASAAGCYVNYLRVGSTVLVPQFGDGSGGRADEEDAAALRALRAAIPAATVSPFRGASVPGATVTDLARLGGVLNCISCSVRQARMPMPAPAAAASGGAGGAGAGAVKAP